MREKEKRIKKIQKNFYLSNRRLGKDFKIVYNIEKDK